MSTTNTASSSSLYHHYSPHIHMCSKKNSLRMSATSVSAEPSTSTSSSSSEASVNTDNANPATPTKNSNTNGALLNDENDKFVARSDREFATWQRQCREIRFKTMQEDSLLFSSSPPSLSLSLSSASLSSPYTLLDIDMTTTPEPSDDAIEQAFHTTMNSTFSESDCKMLLAMSDDEKDRAQWELLQEVEQNLLRLSNPDYDESFFYYSSDNDSDNDSGRMKKEFAMISRAKDLLMDRDRRDLYLSLCSATERGKEWEETIKDVLQQIPSSDESEAEAMQQKYKDSMFEGEDPTTWQI